MRKSNLLLVLAAALSVGACQTQSQKKADGAKAAPSNAMKRPHLPADMNWAGEALPTGDTTTSVITIEKMAPSVLCGDVSFTYTIRVRNISPSTRLTDVTVTDTLPGCGYELENATPEATRTADGLVWNLGDMKPGAMEEITVRGRASSSMGGMPCCASVTYGPKPTPPAPVAKPVPPPPPVLTAGLELTKTTPADTCVYDEIPIKLVVKNPGNGKATDVTVVDTLPEGWTVNGQKTVTFKVGELAPGASKQLTASARASATGKFTNTATASAAGGLGATASSSTAVHKAVLEIAKTASTATEIIGRTATFTITVKNTGDWPAGNCTIRDTMTGADKIGAISDGGTSSGGVVTWNLGELAPGASRTVTVAAGRSTAGTLENTATVSGHCGEPVNASARTTFVGVPAVLLEVIDSPDPIAVGGTTTYTITVTNQGTAPDADIAVEAMYEAGVEFVSADGATAGSAKDGKVTFVKLAKLDPKTSAKWTITVRGTKAADTRFKVALNTKETTRPIEETEATRFYE